MKQIGNGKGIGLFQPAEARIVKGLGVTVVKPTHVTSHRNGHRYRNLYLSGQTGNCRSDEARIVKGLGVTVVKPTHVTSHRNGHRYRNLYLFQPCAN